MAGAECGWGRAMIHAALVSLVALLQPAPEQSVPGSSAMIRGIVTCEGRPVAGATVLVADTYLTLPGVMFHASHLTGATRTTDASGAFEFTGARPDALYAVVAAAPGLHRVPDPDADAYHAPGQEIRIELTPPEVARAEGLRAREIAVVDAAGLTRPGAIVEVVSLGNAHGQQPATPLTPGSLAVTDGEGRATLLYRASPRHSVERLLVYATAAGHGPSGTVSIDVRRDDPEPAIVWLTEESVLRGRLVRSGKPIAGARVAAMAITKNDRLHPRFERSGMTDSNGAFEIRGLPAATPFTLTAVSDARIGVACASQTPDTPGDLDLGDIELLPTLTLAGHVRTRDGEPLPEGHHISVNHSNAWLGWHNPINPDGSFRVEGIPAGGPYEISLLAGDFMMSPLNASYREGYFVSLTGMVTRDHTDMVIMLERRPSPRHP